MTPFYFTSTFSIVIGMLQESHIAQPRACASDTCLSLKTAFFLQRVHFAVIFVATFFLVLSVNDAPADGVTNAFT
jgi:hypothetical protein